MSGELEPQRRARRRGALVATALAGALLAAPPAGAQELALKRTAVRPRPTACPATAPPRQPAAEQRDEARQRVSLAQEAAIVGNQAAAREQFGRAAQLDPTSEDIAYQFGRVLEDAGSRDDALRQYCRYLVLAPAGPDAADVRSRVAALVPAAPTGAADQATPRFRSGLAAYDRAQYHAAAEAFGGAIAEAPAWADAHYNRALAYLGEEQRARAAADLRRYLELRPDAPDRVAVLNRLDLLERPLPFTASGALARGIVPGLGQFYTRRPVFGVAVLAAAAGGAVLASRQRTELREDSVPFIDIAGQRQFYKTTVSKRVYPNMAAGVALAGGVTAAAAIEAYLYARRVNGAARSGGARRVSSLRVRPVPGLAHGGPGVVIDAPLPALLGGARR